MREALNHTAAKLSKTLRLRLGAFVCDVFVVKRMKFEKKIVF